MSRNVILIILSVIISGLILYFVFREIGTEDIWQAFLSFSPWGIFWVLLLTILWHLFEILRLKTILKDKGYSLSINQLIAPWLAGFSIVFFMPALVLGDDAMRAYILKKRFSVSWTKGAVSVFIDEFLDGTIFFLTIILGIVFFILKTLTIPLELWIIILALLVPIGAIAFFYFRAFKSQSMLKFIEKPLQKLIQNETSLKAVNLEKELFSFFKKDNKNMWKAMILSVAQGIINWLRIWVLLLFLGLPISGLESLIMISFTNLAHLFPLPGAIGSQEALQVFVFSKLGFASESAIAFTFIFRAFDLLASLIGIIIVFRFGAEQIKKALNPKSH
ncbi:MAG TPA: lysylphosphatidylglycerol synthase transmembrane domain-containing protein [Candidatus Pacearchaeota archaeon]|nr:lysylphosphatidylglycerol synthase transmembrane domain-containing protein [Candidatus Pacearchaeota archaeon]HOK93996.1 lysylphosphatidylglycerol synthase transmembrane domain-containing protein [Candidatus Pacearchaeota archaeon]HPO75067.1 lysylphosphatidylglycerol synthase transmembrane domain-containing protein [Candidatus Pacearchaeota archaeon]